MATQAQTCIIIGASHAGAQLANTLRKEGWEGKILLIGDESAAPYHRPPLSKALLTGEKTAEQIDIFKSMVYEKANVDIQLNTRVASIDRHKKTISLSSGESLAYDKLALCTGARVRELSIPGSDAKGIFYLRTLADAQAILSSVKPKGKAVIVGGGYIGLETAASLSKLGMEVSVLEMAERVLERVTAPVLSTYYTKLHEAHGIKIHTSATAQSFGKNDSTGEVTSVQCDNGLNLEADLVIVGIGVIPNTELAAHAGLETDNGIIVDEYARTNDADIVAAGDCTFHPNSLLGMSLRLESVPNAMGQAKTAAASICGNEKTYSELPWFWSDQYDTKLQIAGFNKDYNQVVVRGDADSNNFVTWYLNGDELLAADCINSPKEFMLAKKLLANKAKPSAEQLADESFDLAGLLT